MKVKIVNGFQRVMSIAEMEPGQVGVTREGNLFVRTSDSAFCLNAYGKSYSGNAAKVDGLVTILPPGTRIELEVE